MRRPERRPVRRRGRSGRRRDDAGGCGRRRRRRVPRPPREAGWSGRKRRAGAQGGQAEGQVGAAAVSERASVGGVAGPGARPRQSCGLRGAAAGVLLPTPPPRPASHPCLDFLLAIWEPVATAPGCGVPTLGIHVSLCTGWNARRA